MSDGAFCPACRKYYGGEPWHCKCATPPPLSSQLSAIQLAVAQKEVRELKEKLATQKDLLQVCEKRHVWRTAYAKPGCPFCAQLAAAEAESARLRELLQVAEGALEFYASTVWGSKTLYQIPQRAVEALARLRAGKN
jgi:hypothetical protein